MFSGLVSGSSYRETFSILLCWLLLFIEGDLTKLLGFYKKGLDLFSISILNDGLEPDGITLLSSCYSKEISTPL